MQSDIVENQLKTPYYLVDETLLINNLKILREVADSAGCKILLAQKAFSMFSLYPLVGKYLDGTTASGLFEAKLGRECMNKENHIFAPSYDEADFSEITNICDHIIFNSFSEWERHREAAILSGKSFGIRINPEFSTQIGHQIYDPCAPLSRMGVTEKNFRPDLLDGIDGLHFHTLCQQNSDDLEATLSVVIAKFGKYFSKIKWINFGGGHHITRSDYDRTRLIRIIKDLKQKYGLTVYLEPGEAIALNSGFLVSSVMDIVDNGMKIAILDASAACHMPDVLEMPYRPYIIDSGLLGEKKYGYRFAGNTCLAGDVIGDYSFDSELKRGDKLVFTDMAIYSMVKNNTFNGIKLPSIALRGTNGEISLVKAFGYEEFKNRLS